MSKDKKVVQPDPESVCEPIKDWPEAERPREKLFQLGPEGLSDGELLAILLRIGKSGQSAEEMGRHLLSQFKGINGIDRAHFEELLAVPGMGIAKTAQLKAAINKPIASLFDLPKSDKSKIKTEILFIERCLDLLKPGGRMGIVLPEGVYNNP